MTYAIKDLNKEAAAHDLELVKGDGYFYWVHPERVDIPSVYVAAFRGTADQGRETVFLPERPVGQRPHRPD